MTSVPTSLRDTCDVLVVGAGSSGAAIAGRLSERGVDVQLLEAGPDWRSEACPPSLRRPWDQFEWHVDNVPPGYWWPELTARRTSGGPATGYLRGKGLGGTSTINGCFAIRPPLEEFDDWVTAGCAGWGADDVLPYFNRLEDDVDFGDEAYHGRGGPIPITRLPVEHWGSVDHVVAEAAQAYGHPWVPDYHTPGALGASTSAYNIRLGARVTTNDGYLEPARHRANLAIRTDVVVDRVLLEGDRAVGVVAWTGDERHEVRAERVVLCAGTVHTPGILLRSGLGPADRLRELGIDVQADLPVGRGVQDHVGFELQLRVSEGKQALTGQRGNVTVRYTSGLGRAGDTILTTVNVPKRGEPVGGLLCKTAECFSRGTIDIPSADPHAVPLVDLALASDARDVAALADMLRTAVSMLRTTTGSGTRLVEVFGGDGRPLPDVDDGAAVDAWVRTRCHDTAHVSSSCPMGADDDPAAVVDPGLRVRGVEGLLVADASVTPTVPRANTHLTAVMIGERTADLLAPVGR